MKCNQAEYIAFFTKWLSYQFNRPSDRLRNLLLIGEVKRIVTDDEEAAYWGDRDCWTMYDIVSKQMQSKAIEAVTE